MPRAEAKLGAGDEEGNDWDTISVVQRRCGSKGSKQNLAERAAAVRRCGSGLSAPCVLGACLGGW